MRSRTLAICMALCCCPFPGQADEEHPGPEEVRWVLPVAFPKAQALDLAEQAEELRKLLRTSFEVIETERNPVCCLWLEVGLWRPRPHLPGYLIIIQPHGARLIASDAEQLDAAIGALRQAMRIEEDQVYLPVGVLTNYRLIAAD